MSTDAPGTNLFMHAEAIDIPAGTRIFSQGDPGDFLYAVQEGEVEIVVNDVVVETVGPQGIFGELALLDQGPRTSTAVAKTDCRLARADQTQFMLMLRQTPFFAIQVMRILAHRLRSTDTHVRAASG